MARLTRAEIKERVDQVVALLRELPVAEMRGLRRVLVDEEHDLEELVRLLRYAQVRASTVIRTRAAKSGALTVVAGAADAVPREIRGAMAEASLQEAERAAKVVARKVCAAAVALQVTRANSPLYWPVHEPRAGERWVIRERHPSRLRREAGRQVVEVLAVEPPRHETVVVYRDPSGEVVRVSLRQWAGSAPAEWSAVDAEDPSIQVGGMGQPTSRSPSCAS